MTGSRRNKHQRHDRAVQARGFHFAARDWRATRTSQFQLRCRSASSDARIAHACPNRRARLTAHDAAILRGLGGSLSPSNIACHNERVHPPICPRGRMRAPCSRRRSRRGSKRSAQSALPEWQKISPRCSKTAIIAAIITRSPILPMRRSKTRSRCWCAKTHRASTAGLGAKNRRSVAAQIEKKAGDGI